MSTMASIGAAVAGAAGVENVTYGLTMPLTSGGGRCCWGTTITSDGGTTATPVIHPVTPSYFETLDIPLRAGRAWTEAEGRADPIPVVVSEGVAMELWGGSNAAIGRRLETDRMSMIVAGVAGDTRHYGIEDDPDPGLYVPVERLPFPIDRAHLAVRLRPGSSASVGQDLRQAIWSVAPGVPVPVVRSMEEWLAIDTASRRFDSALFSTFAALALVLAAGGLYGTLLYLASQRRRELGIRMALGASRTRIERDVVAGGVGMASLGVILGLGGSAGFSRTACGVWRPVTSRPLRVPRCSCSLRPRSRAGSRPEEPVESIPSRRCAWNEVGSDPDLGQHPLEVSSEHERDVRVGIAAPDQSLGEVEDALGVVEPGDALAPLLVHVHLVAVEVRRVPGRRVVGGPGG
jgi:hypothetical protein